MISSVSVFESSVKPLVSTQLSIEVRCPRLFLGQAPCRVCSGRVHWQLAGARLIGSASWVWSLMHLWLEGQKTRSANHPGKDLQGRWNKRKNWWIAKPKAQLRKNREIILKQKLQIYSKSNWSCRCSPDGAYSAYCMDNPASCRCHYQRSMRNTLDSEYPQGPCSQVVGNWSCWERRFPQAVASYTLVHWLYHPKTSEILLYTASWSDCSAVTVRYVK